MLHRILIGALAGALATAPQSGVVWGLKAAGVYRRRPPPEQVADVLMDATIGRGEVPAGLRTPLMLAQHVGFGAAAGAAFGAVTGIIRPTIAAGVLAGLVIWKASYDGWIPALGIMPPADEDEEGRQMTLLIAHIAYGLALGTIVDRLTSRE